MTIQVKLGPNILHTQNTLGFFLLNENSSTFQIESVKWSHSSKQLYFDESILFILSYTSQFYPFYSEQKVILPSGLQPSNLELTFYSKNRLIPNEENSRLNIVKCFV